MRSYDDAATDKLWNIAQEGIVNGKTHDEIVNMLNAQGVSRIAAAEIVTQTAAHPITKILVARNR